VADEASFDLARWAALPATEETEERFVREELEPVLGPLPRVVEQGPIGRYFKSDHYDYQAVRLKSLAVLGEADPRVRFLDGLMRYLAIRAWMN
jgi:hypothetical protein